MLRRPGCAALGILLLAGCSVGSAGGGLDGGGDGADAGADAGAARPDSGTSPGVDAGSDYGAVRCPNAQYFLCDDFEAGYDTALWSADVQGGTLTSDGSRAARGARSIHTTLGPGGQKALLSAKKPYPMAGAHLWGRAFLYVPASAKASLGRANLVTAYGVNASGGGAVYGAAVGGGDFFGLFFQVSPQVDESSFLFHTGEANTAVPLDRWFCLEWDFNAKDRQLRLFLDGALIPTSVIDGRDAPATGAVNVGPEYGISELWMDSVALAAARVGCDG